MALAFVGNYGEKAIKFILLLTARDTGTADKVMGLDGEQMTMCCQTL